MAQLYNNNDDIIINNNSVEHTCIRKMTVVARSCHQRGVIRSGMQALSEILQTRRLRLAGHVAYSTTIA